MNPPINPITIHGKIVARRILGSHLAFCDIMPSNTDDVIQLTFNHKTSSSNFPNKTSKLPFNATIHAQCNDNNEVITYTLSKMPTTCNNDGSTNISDVLHLRNQMYKEANALAVSSSSSSHKRRRTETIPTASSTSSSSISTPSLPISSTTTTTTTTSSIHQGDKRTKAKRALVFAQWLISIYNTNLLQQGVLDIAGGKGKLSVELILATSGQVQCTVIDPLVRKRPIVSGDKRRLKKQKVSPPLFLHQKFNQTTFMTNHAELLNQKCGLLVGLHPDQVTEEIVDVALLLNKPFAVVPCCVFPEQFSHRKLKNGKKVVSHDDFVQYLIEKDPHRIKATELGFQGRNVVVYSLE